MIGQFDDNLPPQLSSRESFNNEPEPKMKECPECEGKGYTGRKYSKEQTVCTVCDGEKEVEMTADEIREEAINKESSDE